MQNVRNLAHTSLIATNPIGSWWTSATSNNILIRDNYVEEGSINIFFTKNVWLLNNTINNRNLGNVDKQPVDINRNNQDITIVGNNFTTTSAYANGVIHVYVNSNWNISDNYLSGARQGLFLEAGPKNAIIMNNEITKGSQNGILIKPQYFIGNITIKNNRIYNNNGPGIETSQFSYSFSGYGSNANITNNVIFNNTGDGIRETSGNVTLYAKNNIIANNSGYGVNNLSSNGSVYTYNDVWNNALGNYKGTSAGTGDISSDPLFANVSVYDFHLKSQYGRWNGTAWVLDSVTSPAIGTGDPTSDNSKSPWGGRIEMGTYGNTDEASAYITIITTSTTTSTTISTSTTSSTVSTSTTSASTITSTTSTTSTTLTSSTTTTSTTSTTTTFTGSTTTTLPLCSVKGDQPPSDGLVDDWELLDYIREWAKGLVPDFDLLSAIKNWAGG